MPNNLYSRFSNVLSILRWRENCMEVQREDCSLTRLFVLFCSHFLSRYEFDEVRRFLLDEISFLRLLLWVGSVIESFLLLRAILLLLILLSLLNSSLLIISSIRLCLIQCIWNYIIFFLIYLSELTMSASAVNERARMNVERRMIWGIERPERRAITGVREKEKKKEKDKRETILSSYWFISCSWVIRRWFNCEDCEKWQE